MEGSFRLLKGGETSAFSVALLWSVQNFSSTKCFTCVLCLSVRSVILACMTFVDFCFFFLLLLGHLAENGMQIFACHSYYYYIFFFFSFFFIYLSCMHIYIFIYLVFDQYFIIIHRGSYMYVTFIYIYTYFTFLIYFFNTSNQTVLN